MTAAGGKDAGVLRVHVMDDLVDGNGKLLWIDGQPAPVGRIGACDVPVWAGQHTVLMATTGLRGQHGQAQVQVDVAPGQVVELWYLPGQLSTTRLRSRVPGFVGGVLLSILLVGGLIGGMIFLSMR